METYIVQLDFSAAFDRVSNSSLSFKLKSAGVDGSVLSICRELVSIGGRELVSIHRERISLRPQGES